MWVTFNCTLWNWNLDIAIINRFRRTFNCTLWNWNDVSFLWKLQGDILLIVPYGIETIRNRLNVFLTQLLIVPYGIETNLKIIMLYNINLLIVPYGIETSITFIGSNTLRSFNCTLWNWNPTTLLSCLHLYPLLIVPYGIETIPLLHTHIRVRNF